MGLALRTIGCCVAEKPKLPNNFEDITWAKIKEAVTAIHQKQPVSCSLEELYRAVEDLCLHKMAGNLYRRLQQECEVHIAAKLQLLVGQSPDVVVFLSQVESCWQDHCDQMLLIRSIALYLDRTYVIQNSGVLSLWDMGLQLFRCHLSVCPEVELKTVSGLLCLIEQERMGETVDRTLLKHLLRMFSALGIYSESFERQFLECTADFYAAEGTRFMQQTDVPDYLKHVEVCKGGLPLPCSRHAW
jgi:cullin-4